MRLNVRTGKYPCSLYVLREYIKKAKKSKERTKKETKKEIVRYVYTRNRHVIEKKADRIKLPGNIVSNFRSIASANEIRIATTLAMAATTDRAAPIARWLVISCFLLLRSISSRIIGNFNSIDGSTSIFDAVALHHAWHELILLEKKNKDNNINIRKFSFIYFSKVKKR